MSGTAEEKIAAIEDLAVHSSEAGAGEAIVYLHGAGGRIVRCHAGRETSRGHPVAARVRRHTDR